MAAIPEFVLRKLYIPDSLKSVENGYSFDLKNTFSPVTLTGFGLTVDEKLWNPGYIYISLPGVGEIPAGGINIDHPFTLAVNVAMTVRVVGEPPLKRLVIRADTKEAGVLQFGIPVVMEDEEQPLRQASKLEKFGRRVQYAAQVFRAQQDPQHPVYHFAPPSNWMNDPNGLIYWKGNYHLFYQYNPTEAVWGNIHWGHAVSKDMLHWKHLPIAMGPSADGPDAGGCYSGCAVNNNGNPTMIYTGVYPETQCLATAMDDDLIVLKKNPQPVISTPPADLSLEGFRDPCVWQEANEWRMILGSGISGVGGCVFLYRSKNLLNWQYMGVLLQGSVKEREPIFTGSMWECPSLFPMGDRWVLIVSACDEKEGTLYSLYFTGKYAVDRFIPDGPARLLDGGAGGCLYAPQTFVEKKGQRVMFGWLRESRSVEAQKKAGWSGAMSLPRILSLSEKGELNSSPIPEIKQLRINPQVLTKNKNISEVIRGGCLEIVAKIPPEVERWSGVHISCGSDPKDGILVGFDSTNGVVVVDCRHADGTISAIPVDPPAMKDMILHIFMDGSILEVFINDQTPLSARYYLKRPQALYVRMVGDAAATVYKLKI